MADEIENDEAVEEPKPRRRTTKAKTDDADKPEAKTDEPKDDEPQSDDKADDEPAEPKADDKPAEPKADDKPEAKADDKPEAKADEQVVLYASHPILYPGVGSLPKGYTLVDSDVAEKWLASGRVTKPSVEEVKRAFK